MKVKKTPEGKPSTRKVNLENKRGVFFQIGMVISLSIVLLAFEWTTVNTFDLDWNRPDRQDILEELAEITIHQKKKPEMPKPKLIPVIREISNLEEPDEDIDISAEVLEETYNDPNAYVEEIVEIVEEESVIYAYVEEYPEFPGGEVAMMKFLSDHLEFTQAAKEINLQGTVYVYFVVWNDGSIRDVSILRGLGAGLDEEVVRVIESMPRWNPGIQNGKKVNVEFKMPIKFKLN